MCCTHFVDGLDSIKCTFDTGYMCGYNVKNLYNSDIRWSMIDNNDDAFDNNFGTEIPGKYALFVF